MKKTVSLALALLICGSCASFTANAEAVIQNVTIEAPANVIEVEPGQQNVEVTWTITENEGWGAFKCFVEFDGDVFSFVPGGDKAMLEEGELGTYEFFKGDLKKYMQNIGAVTTNIFGIDQGVDPDITKDKSSFLIENKSNTEDSTATGDFFTIYLNIAENAPAGTYNIAVNVDPENQSSVKGPENAVPNITFGTATVKVNGSAAPDEPTIDSRLQAVGAQIRVPSSESQLPVQGLRMISTITSELYAILKDSNSLPKSENDTGIGFGTVVLPTNMLNGSLLTKETANAAIVPAVKIFENPNDTEVKFTACMTNLKTDNYQKEYTYVPYITYMDGENEVTLYGAQYSVSIFEIAKEIQKDETVTEYVKEYVYNNILHVVDPVTYPENGWTGIYRP